MIDETKKQKIRELGVNFNEKMMVELWNEFHFMGTKKYKYLYYDPK